MTSLSDQHHPRQSTKAQPWNTTWKMPALVACTAAIYFPEQWDGWNIDELTLPEPLDAGALCDWADDLGVGLDGRDVGQLWITPALSDQWGLRVAADVSDSVAKMDDDASREQKVNRAVFDALTEVGGGVLDALNDAGWILDNTDRSGRPQLQPRVTVRKTTQRGTRVLRLVLTEFARLWDPNATGPYRDAPALPDADDEPRAYARELARRLGRLTAVLGGIPWGTNAGATGAALADWIRPRSWPTEAGPLPKLERTGGQSELEPTWGWRRRPSGSELDQATHLHAFDGRTSWLARAAGAELGVGQPAWLSSDTAEAFLQTEFTAADLTRCGLGDDDAAQLRQRADRTRRRTLWHAGLWRVQLPSWDHANLLAPHPLMRAQEPVERWVTTPSLRLLREDCELDVPVLEAWLYPQQHRCLDSWAQRLRRALVGDPKAAAEAGERAARAETADERLWWLHRQWLLTLGARGFVTDSRERGEEIDADTWNAVAETVKAIYAVYLQRLSSSRTLRAAQGYRHHHQASWPATVVAEQRRIDWRKIAQHAESSRRYPIAAVRNDEYLYLSPDADPASVAPDEDTGALGKIRHKRSVRLTDEHRRALTQGARAETLLEAA